MRRPIRASPDLLPLPVALEPTEHRCLYLHGFRGTLFGTTTQLPLQSSATVLPRHTAWYLRTGSKSARPG
jgi:hypothetical protein